MVNEKPTVMIVDDEPGVRLLVRQMLLRAGYQVVEAEDGKKAHTLMKAHLADLVITDMVMPDKEGVEVIQSFRKEFPRVKIIAISGAFMGGHYLQIAKALGADAVLPKPFRELELVGLVRQFVSPES
jgi:CheY-like chemotaxis protein